MIPSRGDLLASGGIYPVIIPLDWVLIDAKGEEESLPRLPGATVHRILVKGALLATESQRYDESEMVTVRQYQTKRRRRKPGRYKGKVGTAESEPNNTLGGNV
jgi:hypothetical protein